MHKLWKLSSRAATAGLVVGAALNASATPPRAVVSEAAARATALAAVPSGRIESAELETEGGRSVWSFDIRSPKSSAVTEILIDATTGQIVSKKLESAADQKREAQADKATKR